MALTSNSSRTKINFGQLVDKITDDPKVAPIDTLEPEKSTKEKQILSENTEKKPVNTEIDTSDREQSSREESSLNKQFASKTKKPKGYAKSVYLAADVYEYVSDIANKYNINISQVINIIIRETKNQEE